VSYLFPQTACQDSNEEEEDDVQVRATDEDRLGSPGNLPRTGVEIVLSLARGSQGY
jgi:hypothetical protein